jgi:transposase
MAKNDKLSPFPGKGYLKPEDAEIRQLKRELEIARMERDILKKAAVIFLQPPKAGIRL